MKSKIALGFIIIYHAVQKILDMRAYRRHSLRQYGYYDLRIEWWYWCERMQGKVWSVCFNIHPQLADWYDRHTPTCYRRRKDAERNANERVARSRR